jgi:hypothetical protein
MRTAESLLILRALVFGWQTLPATEGVYFRPIGAILHLSIAPFQLWNGERLQVANCHGPLKSTSKPLIHNKAS